MFGPTQRSGVEASETTRGGGLVLDAVTARGVAPPIPIATPALHLFLHAAFAARDPADLADEARNTAALFGVGAISQAAILDRLSEREARSLARALLRWSFGVGYLRAWQWERALRQQALTADGRSACHEGGACLLGWLQGQNPAQRLARLLDGGAPMGRRVMPGARPVPVRPLASRAH